MMRPQLSDEADYVDKPVVALVRPTTYTIYRFVYAADRIVTLKDKINEYGSTSVKTFAFRTHQK